MGEGWNQISTEVKPYVPSSANSLKVLDGRAEAEVWCLTLAFRAPYRVALIYHCSPPLIIPYKCPVFCLTLPIPKWHPRILTPNVFLHLFPLLRILLLNATCKLWHHNSIPLKVLLYKTPSINTEICSKWLVGAWHWGFMAGKAASISLCDLRKPLLWQWVFGDLFATV